MDLVWDTTTVAGGDQFAYWRDVVWEAFVPVTLRRPGEGAFPSSIAAQSVGPIDLSRIASQAQSVVRTPSDIARSAGGVYFVNLPLSQGATVTQEGRVARLRPGDFAIVDSDLAFRLDFSDCFDQVSLAIPKELLDPMLSSPADVTAWRIDGNRGVGALVVAEIRDLAARAHGLGPTDARVVADHIAGLVALAIRGLRRRPTANPGLLFRAAVDEIEASLQDPGLAPSVVADRLSISVRYLHRLFAQHGTTFGKWLLHRRLEACRRCLEGPPGQESTVTDLSVRYGFGDPSYLARAFKRAYNVTPREYRLQIDRTQSDLEA